MPATINCKVLQALCEYTCIYVQMMQKSIELLTRDGDSSQRLGLESRLESLFLGLATCLRLACNELRLDLKDLRLDLGLESETWCLATCTSAHFIHRSKTNHSVNSLISNSEQFTARHAHCKIIRILQCDGQRDGQTDGQNYDSQDRASIAASRGKNVIHRLSRLKLPTLTYRRLWGDMIEVFLPRDAMLARSWES